jgi:2-polyprenyl-3-methyl-5-hydroxy-6-metoxy-1,4-benzoquinol methylase
MEAAVVSLWSIPPSRQPELMDDHVSALRALARINALSWTAAGIARSIAALVAGDRAADRGPLAVVDVACGGGDVTIDLAARLTTLARSGTLGPPRVTGMDISPRAVEHARELASRRGVDVAFEVRDAAAGCPPCDVAVSSLFLHHLDDDAAVRLLRSMAASVRLGIVVSDLVRSRRGLALAVLGTRLLCSSRVARVDGPLSVRAARTPAEYRALCAAAGLGTARIRRVWPERVIIAWSRAAAGGGDRHVGAVA